MMDLSVGIYMGLYVSELFCYVAASLIFLSDGPLFAFSLFTPTIIAQVRGVCY